MIARTMFDHLLERLTSNPEVLHEYGALRSSLHLSRDADAHCSALVTSAQPLEGKTTVLLNLALVTVLSGRSVVVLDADMRRPHIHRMLGLPNTVGLSDVLAGRAQVQDVIQSVKATDERLVGEGSLAVITAGRDGTAFTEALGESTLRETVQHLTRAYDLLLIDSPPVLAAQDALLLASLVDGVVVVVHTGSVTIEDLTLTKTRLEEAGGRILGAVMTRFDSRVHGPASHPYAAYYA